MNYPKEFENHPTDIIENLNKSKDINEKIQIFEKILYNCFIIDNVDGEGHWDSNNKISFKSKFLRKDNLYFFIKYEVEEIKQINEYLEKILFNELKRDDKIELYKLLHESRKKKLIEKKYLYKYYSKHEVNEFNEEFIEENPPKNIWSKFIKWASGSTPSVRLFVAENRFLYDTFSGTKIDISDLEIFAYTPTNIIYEELSKRDGYLNSYEKIPSLIDFSNLFLNNQNKLVNVKWLKFLILLNDNDPKLYEDLRSYFSEKY